MRITSRSILMFAMGLFCVAVLGSQRSKVATTPQEPPRLDRLVDWLDDPATAWVATAWLQQIGKPALPALLTPGATLPGPHGRFSPRMLALAKIGEPAIPAIAERLSEIQRRPEQPDRGEALALVQVLGGIGLAAIPALVEAAASSATSGIASRALEEIIAFEPPESFGELPDPWAAWRPQDDRVARIASYVTPLLPRIREVMEREARAWRPQSPAPQRSAAYLLARWGAALDRARGLEVLDKLARADEPFYYSLESARLLYRLRAPGVASLLRQIAVRIPIADDLKDQYLLRIGIALFDIGDASYFDLISSALGSGNLDAQKKAIRFAGAAGDLRLAPLLINLLGDETETGSESVGTIKGRTVRTRETIGDSAAASLRALTFQSIGRDSARWREWWKLHSRSSRRRLVFRLVGRLAGRITSMPIWEANRQIDQLSATTDAPVMALLASYIDRPDLDASAVGPNIHRGSGGLGPLGQSGPEVITILLRFAQLGQDGGRSLLEHALRSVDPDVRHYAALGVGSYDRRTALDHLTKELARPDDGFRSQAADFLLAFDDARAIPILIDRLNSDYEATRQLACRDLRIYTQQPLPCDSALPSPERAANAERWRSWWNTVPTFQVKGRQAALDRLAGPEVLPVSFEQGFHVAQAGHHLETAHDKPH